LFVPGVGRIEKEGNFSVGHIGPSANRSQHWARGATSASAHTKAACV
jgi:hypothetical protein